MIAYYIGRVLVVVQTSTSTLSVPMVFCMSVHVRVLFVREQSAYFRVGEGVFESFAVCCRRSCLILKQILLELA